MIRPEPERMVTQLDRASRPYALRVSQPRTDPTSAVRLTGRNAGQEPIRRVDV